MDGVNKVIKQRMNELGLEPNDLVLRYCAHLQSKGVKNATPASRRNMIYRVLSGETKPRIDTFFDIIASLNGSILIEWKDTKVVGMDNSGGSDERIHQGNPCQHSNW